MCRGISFNVKFKAKRLPAFSLLEMAFVIMIMGCLLTVALPFFSNQIIVEREKKTRGTLEQLAHSLAVHLLRHGRLPCPSVVTAQDEDFGREDLSACDKAGIIPYKTLGMSPALAKDGSAHYITYAANPMFAEKQRKFDDDEAPKDNFSEKSSSESYCNVKNPVFFKIFDDKKQLINEESSNDAVFILISHGNNGGEIMVSGERRPLSIKDDFKAENANDDGIFVDAPKTKTFDDTLFWKDRYTFASSYAGVKCK